ncbi:MAG: WXG100 family type VII secretion target [Lachnospiraceae bacterium]|nr:WXG100 family type VII secretion target [Lachnospiraceae bacterium]
MSSIMLKVKPDVLISKSDEIRQSIKVIDKNFKEIDKLITGTKNYWQGDASDTHVQQYQRMKEDFDTIVKRLMEHPTDLEKMAGVYQEVEEAIEQMATSLPTDVISF